MKKRYYRFGERFMERGGIYGRSKDYPHTGGRTRRVFTTVIAVSFKRFCRDTANVRAFNSMHPLLAYQLRPKGWWPEPPPARKAMPVDEVWLEAA